MITQDLKLVSDAIAYADDQRLEQNDNTFIKAQQALGRIRAALEKAGINGEHMKGRGK